MAADGSADLLLLTRGLRVADAVVNWWGPDARSPRGRRFNQYRHGRHRRDELSPLEEPIRIDPCSSAVQALSEPSRHKA